MNDRTIKKLAQDLAAEISEITVYDVNQVAKMIEVRTSICIGEIIKEYSTEAELEYLNLREKLYRSIKYSDEYWEISHKLTFAKHKKTSANRVVNNISREDYYKRLKQFVYEKYGTDSLEDFYSVEFDKKTETKPVNL